MKNKKNYYPRKNYKYRDDSPCRRDSSSSIRRRLSEQEAQMSRLRVIQLNLVYMVGLPSRLQDEQVLKRQQWMGKYGSIVRISTNKNRSSSSFSAYITYEKDYQAALAILAVDNLQIDQRIMRATFGATKYCSSFLKGLECTQSACLFLHAYGKQELIVSKDEQQIKNIFNSQQQQVINLFMKNIDKIKLLQSQRSQLPSIEDVLTKVLRIQEDRKRESQQRARQQLLLQNKLQLQDESADQHVIRKLAKVFLYSELNKQSKMWFADKKEPLLSQELFNGYLIDLICQQ